MAETKNIEDHLLALPRDTQRELYGQFFLAYLLQKKEVRRQKPLTILRRLEDLFKFHPDDVVEIEKQVQRNLDSVEALLRGFE